MKSHHNRNRKYKKLYKKYCALKLDETRLCTLYDELLIKLKDNEKEMNSMKNIIDNEKNINNEFGSMNINLLEINQTLYNKSMRLEEKIKELEKEIKNKFCCIM
jgi:6-phosphogluconolactonase/glucosamine-6-phosphate isomerase/deaminase